MRRSIDSAFDDHPAEEDDRPPSSWIVGTTDDCEACASEPRIVLTVEEVGRAGYGMVAHLSPANARRLRAAIATALRDFGEDPGA